MVAIRRVSSTVAALALFLIVPSAASAHLLSVSAGPSKCVSPLNGQYTATITVTETYFGGTIENIPVGQNVRELSTSTDRGNTGLNQNYFTQGAVGTQTGPANLGQPTSFTSPSSGAAATQTFTVTTSVPETYVLGNSYMRSPSSATVTAPTGGCTPPPAPPAVSATAATNCVVPLDGTFNATIDITSSAAFSVPAGTSAGSKGVNFLSPSATGAPSSIPAGHSTFTLTGLTQQTVYVIGAPNGNIASVNIVPPTGGCQPPPPPPTCSAGQTLINGVCVTPTCPSGQTLVGGVCTTPSCASGQTLVNGVCVTPTCTGAACNPQPPTCAPSQTLSGGRCVSRPLVTCPAGEKQSGNSCVREACRVSARSAYKVRANEMNTLVVWVRAGGTGVSSARVKITLPGGQTITRTVTSSGNLTVRVKPKHSGILYVRSSGCTNAKIKVFAPKVPTAHHPPAFTG
jgi:hypothetical protein